MFGCISVLVGMFVFNNIEGLNMVRELSGKDQKRKGSSHMGNGIVTEIHCRIVKELNMQFVWSIMDDLIRSTV